MGKAKKFYTLEEAAARLGVSEEQVKQMAARGELQQFRDRDKLMFKCEQVDAMASREESAPGIKLDDSGDTGVISLADSGDTGAISLADTGKQGDAGETGPISLADTGLGETGEISLGSSEDTGEITLADTGPGGSTELSLSDPGGSTEIPLSGTGGLSLDDDPNEGSSGLGLALDDLGSSSALGVGESNDTDSISLSDESAAGTKGKREDARQATGISVFDADEVDDADPMAQTVVTRSPAVDEDLALESVGSGSGLLDLTRESDDTSLGAELLDEIYPNAGAEGSDAKLDTAAGSSGVFDGAITLEAGPASSTAADSAINIPAAARKAGTTAETVEAVQLDLPSPAAVAAPGAVAVAMDYEVFDPVGSGFSAGMLFGSFAALVIALIVAVAAVADVPSIVTVGMSKDSGTLWMYVGILAGVSILFGVIGLFLGRMYNK